MAERLEREFTDRKVHDSNPTSSSRRPLSRLGNWNMRRPGAAHSVAWKHQKREIQLGSRTIALELALARGFFKLSHYDQVGLRNEWVVYRIGVVMATVLTWPTTAGPSEQGLGLPLCPSCRQLTTRLDYGPERLSNTVVEMARGPNSAKTPRLSLSRPGQPESTSALVLTWSVGAAGHRKGLSVERLLFSSFSIQIPNCFYRNSQLPSEAVVTFNPSFLSARLDLCSAFEVW
ncbi:hypothetical protein CSKR_106882 [Clonorchis sinensis]|uniref:Uncharacterized protein n=1 Tax=Clonorchis sinensis TaxID=79923 RepID=A0A419PVX5_CLOSI|nr:hypothetical protein CSKR_106882 [Clonorchis sinensis]